MNAAMDLYITLGILLSSVVLFISGKIRSDIVALLVMLALSLSGVLTVEEALSGFSNNIVIMMAGLFVVGGAIFQTGLAKMISTRILELSGNSEKKLFVMVMLVTGLIGSFVSNTGTVALMLPIVASLAASANMDAKRLLMPIAFASSMGMMTLISTPPNLIISGVLEKAGYGELAFFSFLPVGAITLTLGIVLLLPMSKMLVSKKDKNNKNRKKSEETLTELSRKYQIVQNLYRLKVDENTALAGKTLKELNLSKQYNLTIAKIDRVETKRFLKSTQTLLPDGDSLIETGDVLYVLGYFDNVVFFAQENRLHLMDADATDIDQLATSEATNMDFSSIGIAELVLMSAAKIIDKKVKETGFRNLYNLNILAIRRNDEYLFRNLADERIHASDVLLIQGKWDDIHKLDQNEGEEWVVVGEPLKEQEKVPMTVKAPLAGFIMVCMVAIMAFGILPPVTAVLIAAILMILTGCLRNMDAAYKTINWASIILFAGMIPLSIAMEKTGASTLISGGLVSGLGPFGPLAVMAGIYLATSLTTLFLSNTTTAVLFAPIALQAATTLGVHPKPFLFAVAVAASMCFASPFSTPPNALVMSAGGYKFIDYVKIGLPLQLIYALVMILILPLLFPF